MDIFDTPAANHELGVLFASVPRDDSDHVIQNDVEGVPTVLHDGRPSRYEPLSLHEKSDGPTFQPQTFRGPHDGCGRKSRKSIAWKPSCVRRVQ